MVSRFASAFFTINFTGVFLFSNALLMPHRSLTTKRVLSATTPKRNYFPTQRKEFYRSGDNRTAPSLGFLKNNTELNLEDDEEFQQWVDLISGKPVSETTTTTIYVSKSNLVDLVNQLSQSYMQDDDEDQRPSERRQSSFRKQSKAPTKSEHFEIIEKSPWNFTHIGGYENIKQELGQCVDLLTQYSLYAQYNVRIPKGLILEGPPGNGKTMLAKGFAGECNTSFIALSGSQFQDKYVGVGASRVRELFELARKNTPCVIFIDEIDAIGRKRSSEAEAASAERDNTLNELLVGMDGFQSNEGIFVIGATNRVDLLDPALMRPGRMDKHIFIGPPDEETRTAILNIHLKGKPYNLETISMKYLVDQTSGFSGAQIENWLNEAMLHALRKRQTQMEWKDLEEVMSRVLVGWQPTQHELSPEMIYRIAIHEMGHAIVGMMTKHHTRVSQVIINLSSPTSPGYTQFEKNSSPMHTKEALFEHLMILLAGRIAEELFFETSVSTGAADDLEKAFELAQRMILQYGMGKSSVYPRNSEKYKEIMDDEILAMLNRAYDITYQWIQETKPVMALCATVLVQNGRMDSHQILAIMEEYAKTEVKARKAYEL